ncbi:GNAT family N-acetyltransferase [Ornithinimicrobium sp. Y1847]|uniref:GNAT family N-acetyltransferase n=1 Tax=unclassified Ornithinimicrobium TaxID=2615080 RepID=UPI003B67E8A6
MTLPREFAVPELRTPRLLMRAFGSPDREPFARLNADPEVMKYLQGPMDRERSDAFVDRIALCWAEHGWGLWALEVVETGEFIGYTGLWPAPDVVRAEPDLDTSALPHRWAVEVGWRLAAHAWGQGYAPEAAREALRFGFEEVGLAEIVSFTAAVNRPSWRVMEKIGLRRDPTRDFAHPKVDARAHPELVDHLLYALTATQWREQQAGTPGSR